MKPNVREDEKTQLDELPDFSRRPGMLVFIFLGEVGVGSLETVSGLGWSAECGSGH